MKFLVSVLKHLETFSQNLNIYSSRMLLRRDFPLHGNNMKTLVHQYHIRHSRSWLEKSAEAMFTSEFTSVYSPVTILRQTGLFAARNTFRQRQNVACCNAGIPGILSKGSMILCGWLDWRQTIFSQ